MLFFLSLTQNPPPWSWEAGQPWCGAVLELHCVLVLTSPRWALHCPRASISYWAGSRWKWKTSSVMAAKHRSTATSAPRLLIRAERDFHLNGDWRLESGVAVLLPAPPGTAADPWLAGWMVGYRTCLQTQGGTPRVCLDEPDWMGRCRGHLTTSAWARAPICLVLDSSREKTLS